MLKLVKTLLLWLLLLALPMQGFAAAVAAPHCAPAPAAMQDNHDAHEARHSHSDADHPHHLPANGDSAHDGCAASCCLGALLPAALSLPALPAVSQPVIDHPRHMAGIVHAPPEHRPRALPA